MRTATGHNADRSRFTAPELELGRILAKWDPVSLGGDPAEASDYDDLVRPIMIELGHGSTAPALARTIAQTMSRDYGLTMREQEARAVASTITDWWAALPTAP
jgi:hypothetical protein